MWHSRRAVRLTVHWVTWIYHRHLASGFVISCGGTGASHINNLISNKWGSGQPGRSGVIGLFSCPAQRFSVVQPPKPTAPNLDKVTPEATPKLFPSIRTEARLAVSQPLFVCMQLNPALIGWETWLAFAGILRKCATWHHLCYKSRSDYYQYPWKPPAQSLIPSNLMQDGQSAGHQTKNQKSLADNEIRLT